MDLRPQQALDIWRRTMVDSLRRDAPDLTQRQMAVLLIVYTLPAPHTVRGLAQTLNISKPAVTRALDRLGALDFVRRKPDETDRRSVLVQRTVKGAVFLSDYGELIVAAVRDAVPDPAASTPGAADADGGSPPGNG